MSYWSTTYKRFQPEILNFLRRRLWGQDETAEDLCQETFARAIGARTQMRDRTKVRAYLYTTANNLLINHIQRAKRTKAESDTEHEQDLADRPDPRAKDPHRVAEQTQMRRRIEELVTALPEDQRTAFKMGVVERRPYSEIASEKKWTVTKVKICVYRAKKQLMANLKDYR